MGKLDKNFLEKCLGNLLQRVNSKEITFNREDYLIMQSTPDSNIQKYPTRRCITGVLIPMNSSIVQVRAITEPLVQDKRTKVKVHFYNISQFDEQTVMRIFELATKYIWT